MRRGIGIGAIRQPIITGSSNATNSGSGNNNPSSTSADNSGAGGDGSVELGRRLSEKRLADICQAAEMLETGIRKFVDDNKDEIRNNAFLREKVQPLADSCNVDLGAAISAVPRLKPAGGISLGNIMTELPAALIGGPSDKDGSSAAMKRYFHFLSSRVVALCMRERVLRGPVVPMNVVVSELRKRYPLEDITVNDIVKSIDIIAPLNPNMFVLYQETSASSPSSEVALQQQQQEADSLFIAFRPLQVPSSIAQLMSGSGGGGADELSGSDALRIVVLANDIARVRRRALIAAAKAGSGGNASRPTAGAGSSWALSLGGAAPRATTASTAVAAAAQKESPATIVMIESLGIVEGEQSGSYYVRITPADIVSHLQPTSPATFATTMNAAAGGGNQAGAKKNPWTLKRAKLALKAARSMHEGWFDSVDRSTWLLAHQ